MTVSNSEYYDYSPERWLIIKIESKNDPSYHYRVFGTWGGSYLEGQSWKMNSGIVSVTESDDYFYFKGYTGSIYRCPKRCYGIFSYGMDVLQNIIENSKEVTITEMPEETDWVILNYE